MVPESQSVGIGARLRAAREKRGLTVLQAAEKLHVDARVLEVLEAENFAPLGAEVYVRGHLRRYADLVGEAPEQLQDLYARVSPPRSQPDLTRIRRGRGTGALPRLAVPVGLVLCAVALGAGLWWALTRPGVKPQLIASTMPEAPPAVAAAQASPPVNAPAAASNTALQLGMRFSEVSWVQVQDASGRVLLDGFVPAGTTRSVSGAPPLRVVLGNAGGVALEVDGHALRLAGTVRRRGDAHLLVGAGGEVSPVAPAPGA